MIDRFPLIGVDFTSAPRRAKPITVAHGCFEESRLRVLGLETLFDWQSFDALLLRPGPWLMALDLPFGLPVELIRQLNWPTDWPSLVAHCAALGKEAFRDSLNRIREPRPYGARYLHRSTDLPARSHSPMKLVNPPVGLMFLAGAPRLASAGLHLPGGMQAGDPARIALEAYPGLLARRLGASSYKQDDKRKQTPERRAMREMMLARLAEPDNPLGFAMKPDPPVHARAVDDASGDSLDAMLALVQAAWAWQRRDSNYGLPPDFNPLEGWIVGA